MNKNRSFIYPMIIIGILFFVFGFLTWLNAILIPYFQICLELSNFESLWVAFASFIAYFFMAIPSAYILKYTGYKKGMVLGLIVMATGTLLFLPAAYSRNYLIFLSGLFITGAGLALLQTAANPYIAKIGPIESTAKRVCFMGIANKIAGIASQRVLGAVFLFNADTIILNASKATTSEKNQILGTYVLKVIGPYLVITVILLLLALFIYYARLPEIKDEEEQVQEGSLQPEKVSIIQYPYLVLGVLTLFFSEGCEVIAIDGIIIFARSLGIPLESARFFTEYTLFAMLAGYIMGTLLIPRYLSQHRALQICSTWGILMCVLAYFNSGMISVYCMALMGLGTSLFWGTIWGLAIRDLGKFTRLGSALLIMAVAGGAILPLLFGKLIDVNPHYPQTAILMLIPCYLVLFLFSSWGYKIENWNWSVKTVKKNKIKFHQA